MGIYEKLEILANSAKYDASCASSGSQRKSSMGTTHIAGICHSWAGDGRCISLLKVLLTNYCEFDCSYCINRKSNNIKRAMFKPDELARLTVEFYKRNYIEGLFLSSAIIRNPDYTMELMLKVVKKLRNEYNFGGYIHFKIIPGCDSKLIEEASLFADRVSVNIELPNKTSLTKFCPQKTKETIFNPMKYTSNLILQSKDNKKRQLVPAGQSTQIIIGMDESSDYTILNLAEWLYSKLFLKRIYYSAFVRVNDDTLLPSIEPPILREHRLYQADWLLRFYKFNVNEIIVENQNLDLRFDPKTAWALRNLERFPVDINKSDYEMLLRIPGIGVTSAKKIIKARKFANIRFEDLRKLRIPLKKAINFITINGKYYGLKIQNKEKYTNLLSEAQQDGLFDSSILEKTYISANTGIL